MIWVVLIIGGAAATITFLPQTPHRIAHAFFGYGLNLSDDTAITISKVLFANRLFPYYSPVSEISCCSCCWAISVTVTYLSGSWLFSWKISQANDLNAFFLTNYLHKKLVKENHLIRTIGTSESFGFWWLLSFTYLHMNG